MGFWGGGDHTAAQRFIHSLHTSEWQKGRFFRLTTFSTPFWRYSQTAISNSSSGGLFQWKVYLNMYGASMFKSLKFTSFYNYFQDLRINMRPLSTCCLLSGLEFDGDGWIWSYPDKATNLMRLFFRCRSRPLSWHAGNPFLPLLGC